MQTAAKLQNRNPKGFYRCGGHIISQNTGETFLIELRLVSDPYIVNTLVRSNTAQLTFDARVRQTASMSPNSRTNERDRQTFQMSTTSVLLRMRPTASEQRVFQQMSAMTTPQRDKQTERILRGSIRNFYLSPPGSDKRDKKDMNEQEQTADTVRQSLSSGDSLTPASPLAPLIGTPVTTRQSIDDSSSALTSPARLVSDTPARRQQPPAAGSEQGDSKSGNESGQIDHHTKQPLFRSDSTTSLNTQRAHRQSIGDSPKDDDMLERELKKRQATLETLRGEILSIGTPKSNDETLMLQIQKKEEALLATHITLLRLTLSKRTQNSANSAATSVSSLSRNASRRKQANVDDTGTKQPTHKVAPSNSQDTKAQGESSGVFFVSTRYTSRASPVASRSSELNLGGSTHISAANAITTEPAVPIAHGNTTTKAGKKDKKLTG